MKSNSTVLPLIILITGLLTFPFVIQADTIGGEQAALDHDAYSQDPITADMPGTASEADVLSQQETGSKVAWVAETSQTDRKAILSKWLHMLDTDDIDELGQSGVLAFGTEVPGDLAHAFESIGEDADSPGFLGVLLRTIVAISAGLLIVFAIKKILKKRIARIEHLTPPDNKGQAYLWAAILRSFPALVTLFLLSIISTLVFLLLAGGVSIEGRMLFQAVLGTVLIIQIIKIIGDIIFTPNDNDIRPIEIPEGLVKPLYRAFTISFTLLVSGVLIVHLIKELGAQPQSVAWVKIILGSTVISVFGYLVLYLRQPVADTLLSRIPNDKDSWVREQLSKSWHLPAILYLSAVWFIWIGQVTTGTVVRNGSFIISMLIVPIYFIINHVGNILITSIVDSLGIGQIPEKNSALKDENVLTEEELIERRNAIIAKSQMIYRLLIVAVLVAWVLSLWGYPIPFAAIAVRAIFESLVALALALACWRFASSYIAKKIEETTPEPPQKEDADDEFGGAVALGRSHTLLPMLRKVLGTVLIVMVILIVISSFGVNIGPLLAGAGVIGLAVGFGAQKLVSDILSGFFFLLDDAFRVGEYIKAGSVSGTVETITLRNVMLRHHLGMLQIVPHSDLGAITNMMRGGIVIKFPLEFPYDTDIDKVRKIIKKVGQAMLEDEELGDDFILPVKSQGVNEITNSVMVIRVKFTAKPGKQFVIKREAFRRITEALNAKGIYYAHRKVIVDFPSENIKGTIDEEAKLKALQAGAASALTVDGEAEPSKKSEGENGL